MFSYILEDIFQTKSGAAMF